MNVMTPPPRAPGALDPFRARRSARLAQAVRRARDRVLATLTRLRVGAIGNGAQSAWRSADQYAAAATAAGLPAGGRRQARDAGEDRFADLLLAGTVQPEAPARGAQEPGARRQVQFVLIVAADARWCQALAQSLEAHGYLVLTAGSVRQASDQLAVEPALLILDADLPDASGWDLLDWLGLCGRAIPAVLIAPRGRRVPRQARLRPLLVLPQPVAIETLIAIVQEHLVAPETAYGA